MKRLFIISISAIFISVVWFTGCNDNRDGLVTDVSGPQLSGESGIKVFNIIDVHKTGDLFSSPENFVEVTPVVWDGVSALKPGVTYKMTPETFVKTASLGKDYAEFYKYFMDVEANRVDLGKMKSDDTSLAWVSGSANCIGNGYVYGQASANGGGTIIARAVVRLDDEIYYNLSAPGGTASKMAFCLSGCHSCTVAANDGHEYWSETCTK